MLLAGVLHVYACVATSPVEQGHLLEGIRPKIETVLLEVVAEAYGRMMENEAEFRISGHPPVMTRNPRRQEIMR
jgi:hypothetical protein